MLPAAMRVRDKVLVIGGTMVANHTTEVGGERVYVQIKEAIVMK